MKKVISLLLIVMLLIGGLFTLTGCESKDGENGGSGNESPKYSKEVETYTIERSDKSGTITFELAKDLGYEVKSSGSTTNGLTFSNDTDKSKISIRAYYDYIQSSNITKEEKDFYSDSYQDYEKINIAGHEGWQIFEVKNNITDYKSALVLTEADDSNKVFAIGIEITQSYLAEGASFNVREFIASEDYVHMIESMKVEAASKEEMEEANKVEQAYGEFAGRTDGYSDKDGLLFIKSFKSPDETLYRAEQSNTNVGIDNWLWYVPEDRQYNDTSIQVRIFPKSGSFDSIDAYKAKKGDRYTWSKTTIAGKEYDTFVFGDGSEIAKYSKNYQGAFMVGNRVVEFSYTMYAEMPDQDLGDTFFNQILDSIEYAESFK